MTVLTEIKRVPVYKKENGGTIFVGGTGSDITDEKLWKGRVKKKVITQSMVLQLMRIAENKGNKDFKKSLWNTYHCLNYISSAGDKVYGKYCKNRFCTVCMGNRKAEIMRKYLPILKSWAEPYFVTLTVKAVPARRLKIVIDKVIEGFQIIKEKYRNTNRTGKSLKLIGIKSLECNFNPDKRTYNPHLHILVPNKEIAEILVKEWLLLWKQKGNVIWTIRKGQFIRPVKDKERDLRETVKYGTKIFTEPDLNKRSTEKVPRKIYILALYNILMAFKGRRLFDRFGFNLPPGIKYSDETVKQLDNYDEWVHKPKLTNWVNTNTGEILTDFLPPSELLYLLTNCIDNIKH